MPVVWSYTLTPPDAPTSEELDARATIQGFTDYALDHNGDLALEVRADGSKDFYLVRGADAIAQRLFIRFRFWQGEWFLDEREGMPYLSHVLGKNREPKILRALFRKVIVTVPGIRDVTDLNVSLDRRTRTLTVGEFRARLADGSQIDLVDKAFIVA